MSKIQKIIAIIVGLLSILGSLNSIFGLPIPSLLYFNKHTVSHISTNPQFAIETVKTKDKVAINPGDSFSYKFGTPLTVRGTTSFPDSEMVWVLVADEMGYFYLQQPLVVIRSGSWVATNIVPLEGIKRIIFAKVDAEGNRSFMNKVERNEWGKFKALPVGITELAVIELE